MMKKLIYFVLLFIVGVCAFGQDIVSSEVKTEKNGWDYYAEGKYTDSLKALDAEKRLFPDRINIYVISAWCYRELKDYASMENASIEGLKIQPTDSRVYRNLAEAQLWQQKYSDAAKNFDSYLKYKYQPKTDPYFSTVYHYLGLCYYNMKQLRKADICFSTANRYLPRNIYTIQYLADVKDQLGEYQKAYDLYSLSLKIKENNPKGLEGINRLKDKIN